MNRPGHDPLGRYKSILFGQAVPSFQETKAAIVDDDTGRSLLDQKVAGAQDLFFRMSALRASLPGLSPAWPGREVRGERDPHLRPLSALWRGSTPRPIVHRVLHRMQPQVRLLPELGHQHHAREWETYPTS